MPIVVEIYNKAVQIGRICRSILNHMCSSVYALLILKFLGHGVVDLGRSLPCDIETDGIVCPKCAP